MKSIFEIKQREIAKAIKRSPSTVSLIMSRKRKPSLDVALKLERLYGIKPSFWIKP